MRRITVTAAMLMLTLALCAGAAFAATPADTYGGRPDLDLTKTVSPKVVRVGEPQTFTIRVTNEGAGRAEGVRMTDPLPSKVRFVRASTSRDVPGSCGIDDRVVACRLGTLRSGKTVTVKIHVKPVVEGPYSNRAYVSHGSPADRAPDTQGDSDAARALVEARKS